MLINAQFVSIVCGAPRSSALPCHHPSRQACFTAGPAVSTIVAQSLAVGFQYLSSIDI